MNAITSSKEDLWKELTENVSARMDKMQSEAEAIQIRHKHNFQVVYVQGWLRRNTDFWPRFC